ncbi:MAG: four helix bundle protein [Chitinophagaceae bacterium]|nr:four helix bundle protein [Chitinophagaceae bacterium]
MKEGNLIEVKSFEFAVRIVRLYKYLIESMREFVLSKQVLRSGTSIGAKGNTRNRILAKETYWLRLMKEFSYLGCVQ